MCICQCPFAFVLPYYIYMSASASVVVNLCLCRFAHVNAGACNIVYCLLFQGRSNITAFDLALFVCLCCGSVFLHLSPPKTQMGVYSFCCV